VITVRLRQEIEVPVVEHVTICENVHEEGRPRLVQNSHKNGADGFLAEQRQPRYGEVMVRTPAAR
jgi:hypothetical protein